MALNVLDDCTFAGPALTEPFVRYELEKELVRLGLLPRPTGDEARAFEESWASYRRGLRDLVSQGGSIRVGNHVLEPLVSRLGYERIEDAPDIETREGREAGGRLMLANGSRLRAWATSLDEDLDAPTRRGRAYRFSHVRIAERVLLASGERLGLLTNGTELRVLISDPARPDSQVIVKIDPNWKRTRDVPDSYRLLLALASPKGAEKLPEIVEKARLQQAQVTRELRRQAREAVEAFVQEVLDHPENRDRLAAIGDRERLARDLWHEGLVLVYRLLFILKLETSDDPARAFAFASTSLWRRTFSPSVALAPIVREVLDRGAETGRLLEDGLRHCFRLFVDGLKSTELNVQPLGGALFGDAAMPLLSGLRWGERAVAKLLDRLLWTHPQRGSQAPMRVHYGPLDVEDLGRVYEALLELEPGISSEPMCRLRRQKLEVVIPLVQGDRYRPALATASADVTEAEGAEGAEDEETAESEEEEEAPARAKKTKVEWVEEIPPGRFFLRVGLGRKSTGSYYTPHSFVRFLVQETLGPQVEKLSPRDDPRPGAILALKVLDPAMGSGHFLVEACRFLGEKLYEACRLCDDLAFKAEKKAENAKAAADRDAARAEAAEYLRRVVDLPDPDDELVRYLPSHSAERAESGVSQKKAEALCRRLVAVHCLYGVDKNPLAVELAKLSLWIESHAEGLPLTFLDHRLVLGDSLTGPFFERLLKYPGNQSPMDDLSKGTTGGLFTKGLTESFTRMLIEALRHVADLEATVGVSLSEVESKRAAKARLDRALAPFKILAAAWSGGVMLGRDQCDDQGYAGLVRHIAEKGDLPETIPAASRLPQMIARGLGVEEIPSARDALLALVTSGGCVPALPYELAFPEAFFPKGSLADRKGFDAVLGNPPWETIRRTDNQFFGMRDLAALAGATKREKSEIQSRLLNSPGTRGAYEAYVESFIAFDRVADALFSTHKARVANQLAGRGTYDAYMLFAERAPNLLSLEGRCGWVLPSAFHANEGATGVRRLYLEMMGVRCCFSFENRRKLFEIDSRFKFALVVASRSGPTTEFPCAFYLHDDEWLFGDRGDRELRYTLDFVRRTGGEYLSLLEIRSPKDLEVAEVCFASGKPFGEVCEQLGIRMSQELNMTYDSWRFTSTDQVLPGGEDPRDPDVAERLLSMGYLVLHEGKTFHQYTDAWEDRPRYAVGVSRLTDRHALLLTSRHFRGAIREIARATDERTLICCVLPPGATSGHTVTHERLPGSRATAHLVSLLAALNSFPSDWCIRLTAATHVTHFILDMLPLPSLPKGLLAHSALRLSCNHAGYEPLWREQVGGEWREPKPPFTWPVLEGDDARWEVRAAIDAVVADAYGLSRDQYAHVLSTFSHKSYLKAPALCLARFDELKSVGLDAFTKKHDPYWDIPLNENLPKPVIDIPMLPGTTAAPETGRRPAKPRKRMTLPLELELPLAADTQPPPYTRDPAADPAPTLDEAIYARIRQLLEERATITSADAQSTTGLSATGVRPYLQRLAEEGLAVVEGERRGTRYRARDGRGSSTRDDA